MQKTVVKLKLTHITVDCVQQLNASNLDGGDKNETGVSRFNKIVEKEEQMSNNKGRY